MNKFRIMKRVADDSDSIVAIYLLNEDGSHTGYLVCEKSRLTSEELDLVLLLSFRNDPKIVDDTKNLLAAKNILDTDMIYSENVRKQCHKFRFVDTLENPELPISCLIVSADQQQ